MAWDLAASISMVNRSRKNRLAGKIEIEIGHYTTRHTKAILAILVKYRKKIAYAEGLID